MGRNCYCPSYGHKWNKQARWWKPEGSIWYRHDKGAALNKYVLLAQGVNAFSKASGVILDKTFNSNEYEELRKKSVNVIAGIAKTDAALLKQTFGIDTIQELAENKFVCVAQTIMTLAILEEVAS